MTSPQISVVVITYLRDDMLAQCLASLEAQTLPLHEVVVVDDGGPGSARAVVEQYGERFRYLWQPNGGPQRARNTGSTAATGEWIAYLDDDDLWLPERHTLLAKVAGTGQVDLIAGDFIKFGADWVSSKGVFSEVADLQPGFWDGITHEADAPYSILGSFPTTRLIPTHPFWGATLTIRRDLLVRINGWDESLKGIKSEDIDFVFRAIKHGRLGIIWPASMRYRSHAGNDSQSALLNALGRVQIWEHLLENVELSNIEVTTLTGAVDTARHQILWDAFAKRKFNLVIKISKDINKSKLSFIEISKIFYSKIILLLN